MLHVLSTLCIYYYVLDGGKPTKRSGRATSCVTIVFRVFFAECVTEIFECVWITLCVSTFEIFLCPTWGPPPKKKFFVDVSNDSRKKKFQNVSKIFQYWREARRHTTRPRATRRTHTTRQHILEDKGNILDNIRMKSVHAYTTYAWLCHKTRKNTCFRRVMALQRIKVLFQKFRTIAY